MRNESSRAQHPIPPRDLWRPSCHPPPGLRRTLSLGACYDALCITAFELLSASDACFISRECFNTYVSDGCPACPPDLSLAASPASLPPIHRAHNPPKSGKIIIGRLATAFEPFEQVLQGLNPPAHSSWLLPSTWYFPRLDSPSPPSPSLPPPPPSPDQNVMEKNGLYTR